MYHNKDTLTPKSVSKYPLQKNQNCTEKVISTCYNAITKYCQAGPGPLFIIKREY